MIIIQALSIKNFMNIESAELTFENDSVNIFYGDNGSGKSSIFEAIGVCLTERRRGESFKEMVRLGQDSAEIVLDILYEGEEMHFETTLHRKKSASTSSRLIKYKGDEYLNSDCTRFLDSLNWDHLQHAMFSHQGEYNITDLKAHERTKLLKVIFNLELEDHIQAIDNMVETSNHAVVVYQAQKEAIQNEVLAEQDPHPVLDPQEISNQEAIVAEKKALIQQLQSLINEEKTQELLRSQLEQQLQIHKNQAAQYVSTEQLIQNRLVESDLKITKLQEQITACDKEIASLRQMIIIESADVETVKESINQKEKDLLEYREILSRNLLQQEQLSIKISQYENGVCDKCGQQTDPSQVDDLVQELSLFSKEYNIIEGTKENTQVALKELETTRNKLNNSITTCSSRISTAENTILSNTNMMTMLQESKVQEYSQLHTLQENNKSTLASITSLEAQLANAKKTDFQEHQTAIQQHEQVITAISNQLMQNQSAVLLNVELDKNNKLIRQRIQENEDKQLDLIKAISKENGNLETYKEVKRILSTELPSYAIVKACAKLEKEINRFIKKVRPNMVVRLSQYRGGVSFTYKADVTTESSSEFMSVKMASGFEKQILSVAWRVALGSAYKLKAVMLDEIDSAASTEASESMFAQLALLPQFNQLFIVTHKPDVVDLIKSTADNVRAYHVASGDITLQ